MLNSIVDMLINPNQQHVKLTEKISQLLPDMVAAFSRSEEPPNAKQCEQYQSWAHQLAKVTLLQHWKKCSSK